MGESSITLMGAGVFTVGDTITFAQHLKWWQRLLIWARIRKPKPLKRFVVTHVTSTQCELCHDG